MQQLRRRHKIATVLVFVALLSEERAFGFLQGAATKRESLETRDRDSIHTPAGTKQRGGVSPYVRDVRADSRQSRIDATDIRTDFREIRTVIEQRQCSQAPLLAERRYTNDQREPTSLYRGNRNARETERSGSGSDRENSRLEASRRLSRSREDVSGIGRSTRARSSSASNRPTSELRRVRVMNLAQRSTGQSRNVVRGTERFHREYQTRRNRRSISGLERKSFKFEHRESERSRTADGDLSRNQRLLHHQISSRSTDFIRESRRSSSEAERKRRDRQPTSTRTTDEGTISRRVLKENRSFFRETDATSTTDHTRDHRQLITAVTATGRRDATRATSSDFVGRKWDFIRDRSSRSGTQRERAATARENHNTSRNQRLTEEKNTPLDRRVLEENQEFTREAERSSRADQTRRNRELAASTRNQQNVRNQRSIDEETTERRITREIRDVSTSRDPQRAIRSRDRATEIRSGKAAGEDSPLSRNMDSPYDSTKLFSAKPQAYISDGIVNHILQTVLAMALVGQLLVTTNAKGGLLLTNTWHRFFAKEKVH